ncbi:MAG: hypothetical protein LBI45_07280 [Bacteroidales bacterium]|jgi:hypothetical protein|nr:hypothetical protein [Bacteroidales bacterium]
MKSKFGTTYTQFEKQGTKAIKHLLKVKEGECTKALFRNDIGYIDIVWGKNDPKTNKGYGLKHIFEKHGSEIKRLGFDFATFIILIVEHGNVNLKKSESHKKVFEGEGFRFVIAIDKGKNWLLTAFDILKKPK